MRCIVTGCCGFIGSHLAESLLEKGHIVIGIDNFSSFYDKNIKEKNLDLLIKNKNFIFFNEDLLSINFSKIGSVDFIFHQAAQAGVRSSWQDNFKVYVQDNILTTQRLLEGVLKFFPTLKKFIFASSSSVYGDSSIPMKEENILRPISPYGVTKLASENLVCLYSRNFNIPFISLRYFTVYGPRQRPDMAFHRFIKSILEKKEITIFGNGLQTRDFTYISDIVDANILAMESDIKNEIFNIGGGTQLSINTVISILERLIGKKAKIVYEKKVKGDVKDTLASIEKAKGILGYSPKFSIEEGLKKEIEWIKEVYFPLEYQK